MRTLPIWLALLATATCAAPPVSPEKMQERFIINAQYRGAVTQTLKDVGKGTIDYRRRPDGAFAIEIVGSLKNPDTKDLWRLQVSAEYRLKGQTIHRLDQKVDLSKEAKRYEQVVTHNLPFMYIARFRPLPRGPETEELTYSFEGREYVLRYVTVEDTIEATLYESGVLMGKFFLHGDYGQPPKTLVKARMVSANHIVFSLVVDRQGGASGSRGD